MAPVRRSPVSISIKGVPGFVWRCTTSSQTTVKDIKQKFCRELAIFSDTCALAIQQPQDCHQPNPCDQVPEHVGNKLELQATTDVGLAFAIWVQFQQADLQSNANLATVWKAVLNSCTPDTVWDECGLKHSAMLADFAGRLLPTYSVPPDQFSSPEADLPNNIDPMVKACWWLPKLLLNHCTMPAGTTVEEYVSDIHESVEQGSMPKPPGETAAHESHVSTLRRALMLLKLIFFVTSIKYEAAGVHNVQDMLWPLLSDMLLSYQRRAAHENHLQETCTQEQVLLGLLLQMLVFQAFQLTALRPNRNVLHATMALRILKSLMVGLHIPSFRQAFGAKMLKSGIMHALAAALRVNKDKSVLAVELMHTLLDPKLPTCEVQEAELFLNSLKIQSDLCTMLCPHWTKQDREDRVIQGPDQFGLGLLPGYDVHIAKLAASLLLRLQLHDPKPPSDPTLSLPTPSNAEWVAIKIDACKALVAYHWYRHHPEACAKVTGSGEEVSLTDALGLVAQGFLLGHINNRELDIQQLEQVLKLCCKAMLCGVDPLGKDKVTYPLMAAVMKRLAHNPEHLKLPPRSTQLAGQHLGNACPGCSKCSGPEWQWKTESVASMLPYFCHYVDQRPNPEAAAMMIQVIFAAVDDPQHCQHILRGTHTGPKKHLMGKMVAFCEVVHRPNVDDDLQQVTQLDALACLVRLCQLEREFSSRPDWRPKGAVTTRPWYHEAEHQNAISHLRGPFGMAVVAQALGKAVPWTTNRCVALTRALHAYHHLHEHKPDSPYMKYEAYMLSQAVLMLEHVEEVTSTEYLRTQLVQALMTYLHDAFELFEKDAEIRQETNERLSFVMSDLAMKLPSVDIVMPGGQAVGYPSFGMPDTTRHLWYLRCTWLHNTLYTISDGNHFAYFAKHALGLAKAWFAELVAGGYDRAQEHYPLDPSPYFNMLELCASQPVADQVRLGCADEQSAKDLLLCMHYLVCRVVGYYNIFREDQKLALTRQARGGSKPPAADQTEKMLQLLRFYLDSILTTCERLKKSLLWAPLLSEAAVSKSWHSDASVHDKLYACLVLARMDLQGQAQRIEACVYPKQGKEHTSEAPKLEAKATPIEELLAAEEQSAAKAADKTAKRQKRRAKKQKQKQDKEQHQQEQQAHEAQQQHQLPTAKNDAQPPVLHRQQPGGSVNTLISNAAENGDAEQPFDVMQPADASSAVASSLRSLQLDNVGERQMPDADTQQQSPQGMPGHSEDFLQDFFCCPLTKVMIRDPVIAADGETYERTALEAWLMHSNMSPVTGKALEDKRIIPNLNIRSAISAYCGQLQ